MNYSELARFFVASRYTNKQRKRNCTGSDMSWLNYSGAVHLLKSSVFSEQCFTEREEMFRVRGWRESKKILSKKILWPYSKESKLCFIETQEALSIMENVTTIFLVCFYY